MAQVEIIQLTKPDGTKFYPAIAPAQGTAAWGAEPQTGTEAPITVSGVTKTLLKTEALDSSVSGKVVGTLSYDEIDVLLDVLGIIDING